MDFKELTIERTDNIRTAMQKLDKTSRKILFLLDGKKFVATLTDGDIRRFLLNEGGLDAAVESAANFNPRFADSVETAKQLYHEHNFIAIPILNEKRELVDIYSGKQEQKYPKLKVPVIINAGGRGTRLEPFTSVLPKPLIPVGELPIVEHIMQQFAHYGCSAFHIIVNYKKQLIKAYFKEAENKYSIKYYDEQQPLGTGGGLSLLKGKLTDTFFFTNCDILLRSNYDSMLRFHKEHKNTITMVCAYKNIKIPYGVIEMGKNGSIKSMKEKPEMSVLTNAGMYIVEPCVLEDIEENIAIGFPDIATRQMAKGRRVAVYPVSENEWLDMGQLSELEKMRKELYGE